MNKDVCFPDTLLPIHQLNKLEGEMLKDKASTKEL